MNLSNYFTEFPFIAILRGIQNHECVAVGEALVQVGFSCIEVPMNSPNAIESISLLVKHLPSTCLIGAGTVMSEMQVEQVYQAGGRLIVMPHADVEVISAAKRRGMICTPGVATLTEAFSALTHGADALKLFPAESVPPSVLKAWRSVLPAATLCLPVGGVQPQGMADYLRVGANGFGLGSNLYQAGDSVDQVTGKAEAYALAWRTHML
jgi:2-dehydro-3-deoxyphosphogalactonate aldolase